MAKKRPCPLCRQLHDPKRAPLTFPTLKEKVRPKLPGDYHCPRCGQWDANRLLMTVRILQDSGLPFEEIARRLGVTTVHLRKLCSFE